jgi:hypothetical protein
MSPISRGFQGRRRAEAGPAGAPPGQYVTYDFSVPSAGPTPHTPLHEWSFTIRGVVDEPRSGIWDVMPGLYEYAQTSHSTLAASNPASQADPSGQITKETRTWAR